MLILLFVAASVGGYANYLLPANDGPDGKTKLRSVWNCIVLGVTATIMVPLFLEIAQSKLLENVRFSFTWAPAAANTAVKTDTMVVSITTATDSGKTLNVKADTVVHKAKAAPNTPAAAAATDGGLGKSYLLWLAYCIIAAAAGFRFIDMLINNVIKQGEIKTLKTENKELQEKSEKESQQNRVNAQVAEKKVLEEIVKEKTASLGAKQEAMETARLLPSIGPITHLDDPQKGRFGGRASNNFRCLKARVTSSYIPGFYNVAIWVESTDPVNHPLTDKVVFYIHDSFRPNVYTIDPVNGKAEDDDILSYGAFTVGAIADQGETLLELDLADDPSFPQRFRES